MSISNEELWRLLAESRLLTAEQCQGLSQEFGQVKGAAQQGNVRTLAEWLIARDVISRYQAKILLGGRPGPFVYGEYHVCDLVKQGPLAGSFRAKHASTNHPVILIFLTGTAVQAPRIWGQIVQRVTAYCEVVHPHLARCYEIVDLTSFKFLVMEGLQGQSLDQVQMSAGGRFAPQEACRIARQTAIGLGRLHQAGHVRGDLRPASLWMEPGGNMKVPHNPSVPPGPPDLHSIDPTGRMLARADYLAPELAQAGTTPDVLADIYALGCTLYSLLAGQPPFPAGTISQKMGRHATEPIRPLDSTFGVPEPIAQIVSYMMAKNPSVRYQSATDVANALGSYVDHSVVTPLPALAVATLPVYESAIMAKRARQAAQVGTVAPAQGQASSPQMASPIPVSQAAQPGQATPTQPAASPVRGAAPDSTATNGDDVSDTPAPDSEPEKPGWLSRRNLLLVGGAIAVLMVILTITTCRSCTSGSVPRGTTSEAADDEGSAPAEATGTDTDDPATTPN